MKILISRTRMLLTLIAPAIMSHASECFSQEPIRNSNAPATTFQNAPFASAIVVNSGQWDPRVLWSVPGASATISGVENGFVLSLASPPAADLEKTIFENVYVAFEGANSEAHVEYTDPQGQNHHYFYGNDYDAWRTQVSTYAAVKVIDLYSGVDLILKFDGRRLEYDFICNDAAGLQNVIVRIDGARSLDVGTSGDLLIHLESGIIRQRIPASYWKQTGDQQQTAHCRFRILDDSRIGFELVSESRTASLVVDPTIEFSTYWGGGWGGLNFTEMAADKAGNAVIAGQTSSPWFLTTPGAYDTTYNGTSGSEADAFAMKMNSTGTNLIYSTYIGGNKNEYPTALITSDSIGNAYVCGGTYSTNFPLTPGAPYVHSGVGAYVCKLNTTGSTLLFSTYISNNTTIPYAISADDSGNAYATGHVLAPCLLVTPNAFNPFTTTGMFVSKMDTVNSTIGFGTYISPSNSNDTGYAVAADGVGGVWALGHTTWTGLPVTPTAVDSTSGGFDSILIRINPQGTALDYATYLGFSGGALSHYSSVVYRDPFIYLCLYGHNALPVTVGAYQSAPTQGPVLMKLEPSSASVVFATYLHTLGNTFRRFGLDESGNSYITATIKPTWWVPLPTTADAFKSQVTGPLDGYIMKVNNTGTGLLFASYFGGSGEDWFGRCVGVGKDSVLVLGMPGSLDFPTTPGAFATGGGFSLTRLKLPNDPFGLTRFGTGSPGCTGPHQFTVNEPLSISANNFQFICDHAPPNALGAVIVSDQPDQFGYETLGLGVSFHVGFSSSAFIGIDINSDKWGTGKTLPISLTGATMLTGMRLYAQAVWQWPSTICSPSPANLSTSNGIEIIVQ
ncbi:MAG: hypothetical protein ACKVS6_02685 [Planctomycetota bacterium]